MIFLLRLIIFSFLIFLGFHLSTRSKNLRAVVSVVYGCVLVWYTFLCRVHLYVNVSASDYGHAVVTMSTGEKIWKLLQAIFGMQANGNLAGNYREAFVLNVLLMIPLGYLVLLRFLCGDSSVSASSVGTETRDVITDGDASGSSYSHVNAADLSTTEERKVYLANNALKSILICVATSLLIELLQKITELGMLDINDLIANSIGGGVGVVLVISYVWYKQHQRLRRDLRGKKS